ncbi:MAG: putative ABC-type ATPase [Rickettsiales bacterium]
MPNKNYATKRVSQRVAKGGHNIPVKTIEKRYEKGLKNSMNDYSNLVDELHIYSNEDELKEIALKNKEKLKIQKFSIKLRNIKMKKNKQVEQEFDMKKFLILGNKAIDAAKKENEI